MFDADIAAVARLFAQPVRADIVLALMDGRARTAGELAREAKVAASTASGHLAVLLDGGILEMVAQGRHRYYRLADPAVAEVVEKMSALAPPRTPTSLRQSQRGDALGRARTCYDHLAGRLAIDLCDAMVEHGIVRRGPDHFDVTPAGGELLDRALALDVDEVGRRRRSFAPPCLDWTERRDHIAGAFGAALLTAMLDRGWLRRRPDSRAIDVRPTGVDGLRTVFGLTVGDVFR